VWLDTVQVKRTILPIAQRKPNREQIQMAKWFLEKRPADANLQEHVLRIYAHPFAFYSDINHGQEPDIQGRFYQVTSLTMLDF
jgi:hypothetical protein